MLGSPPTLTLPRKRGEGIFGLDNLNHNPNNIHGMQLNHTSPYL